MKKIVIFFMLVTICTLTSQAKLIWHESFDREVGQNNNGTNNVTDATDYTNWFNSGYNETKIQIVEGSLSYSGYADSKGNKIQLNASGSAKDLRHFEPISTVGSKIYMAAIVNVTSATSSTDPIFCFTDGGTNYYGRVYARNTDDNTGFYFGIGKYAEIVSQRSYTTEKYNFNTNYLVVVEYEFVEGTKNDIVKLYINPTKTQGAANVANQMLEGTDAKQDPSKLAAVCLYKSASMPNAYIDEIKVATTWGDLFTGSETGGEEGEEGEEEETGTITVNPTTVLYGGYAGVPNYEQTVTIQATDITGDITITGSTHVSVTPTTISKEDALAGTTVTLSFYDNNNPENNTTYTETLVFKAEGAKDVQLAVKCTVYASHDLMSPAYFYNDEVDVTGETAYRMTGKAVVYHTDGYKFYIENTLTHSGAVVEIHEAWLSGIYQDMPEVGDEITNICVFLEKSFGNVIAYSTAPYFYKKTAGGKTVNPYELTISEWGDPYTSVQNYPNVLLKISNLNFGEAAGGRFTTDGIEVTDKTGTAKVKVFASSDLIGEEIPETADVVGISLSQSVLTLAPRGKNDILNAKYKTPTALPETATGQSARKQIVAGQLIIERDGKIFNILGTAL